MEVSGSSSLVGVSCERMSEYVLTGAACAENSRIWALVAKGTELVDTLDPYQPVWKNGRVQGILGVDKVVQFLKKIHGNSDVNSQDSYRRSRAVIIQGFQGGKCSNEIYIFSPNAFAKVVYNAITDGECQEQSPEKDFYVRKFFEKEFDAACHVGEDDYCNRAYSLYDRFFRYDYNSKTCHYPKPPTADDLPNLISTGLKVQRVLAKIVCYVSVATFFGAVALGAFSAITFTAAVGAVMGSGALMVVGPFWSDHVKDCEWAALNGAEAEYIVKALPELKKCYVAHQMKLIQDNRKACPQSMEVGFRHGRSI